MRGGVVISFVSLFCFFSGLPRRFFSSFLISFSFPLASHFSALLAMTRRHCERRPEQKYQSGIQLLKKLK